MFAHLASILPYEQQACHRGEYPQRQPTNSAQPQFLENEHQCPGSLLSGNSLLKGTNAGFDLPTAFVGTATIFDYTLGATIEEQLEPGPPTVGPSDPSGTQRVSFDSTRLPMLAAALQAAPEMIAGNRSKGFEAGVQLILAGLRAAKREQRRPGVDAPRKGER